MRTSTPTTGAKLAILTLLAGSGVLVCATAATVYTAGAPRRHEHVNARNSPEPTRSWEPLRALSDSLVAPLAGTASAQSPIDSALLVAMVALVAAPPDSLTWIPHADADTTSSRAIVTYRAWSRAAVLPPFWGLRAELHAAQDIRATPSPRLQVVKRLWKYNEAAADSALAHGDVQTALLRARENIAGARHLLWQPTPIAALVGRVMMADGAKLLARVALQADQPSLHTAAQRLETMVRSSNIMLSSSQLAIQRMSSEPNSGRLTEQAGDRTLHPATRFMAVELMVGSTCANTREVLLGPSPARFVAVEALVDSMHDIPRMRELKPLLRQTLSRFARVDEESLRAFGMREPIDASWSDALIRAFVPTSVQTRADFCKIVGF